MSLQLEEYLYHAYTRASHWFLAVEGIPLDGNNALFFFKILLQPIKIFYHTHNNLTGCNVTAIFRCI